MARSTAQAHDVSERIDADPYVPYGYQNWNVNEPSPFLLNPTPSLHSQIAWCWSEADFLRNIATYLSGNPETQEVVEIFWRQLLPLTAMLEHLGEATKDLESDLEKSGMNDDEVSQFNQGKAHLMRLESVISAHPQLLSDPHILEMFNRARQAYGELETSAEAFGANTQPMRGIFQLVGKLMELQNDLSIQESEPASKILEWFIKLFEAAGPGDAVTMQALLAPYRAQVIAEKQRLVAESKNAGAKAWVKGEWENRRDKTESKTIFSERHQVLVLERFGTQVTADTIARAWLPKG